MFGFLKKYRMRYLHQRAEKAYWQHLKEQTPVSGKDWNIAEYRFARARGMIHLYAFDEFGRYTGIDNPVLYIEVAMFLREVRLGNFTELHFNDSYVLPIMGEHDTHGTPPVVH